MNLVRLIGPHVSSKHDSDDAFFHRNPIPDLEPGFICSARDRSAWRFVHLSILAQGVGLPNHGGNLRPLSRFRAFRS
jgi:hypothetical protein